MLKVRKKSHFSAENECLQEGHLHLYKDFDAEKLLLLLHNCVERSALYRTVTLHFKLEVSFLEITIPKRKITYFTCVMYTIYKLILHFIFSVERFG